MISTVRHLYGIVRPCGRRRLAGVLVIVVLQSILQTVAVFSLAPFLSAAADMARFRASAPGRMFEAAFGNGTDHRLLLAAALTSLVLLVAGNLFSILAELHRSRYAQAVGLRLRSELLRGLLARRYTYFLGVNTSLLTKYLIEDVSNVAIMILAPVLDLLSRVLLVALLCVTALLFDPLVVLGGGLLIGAYYLIVMRPVRRAAARASDLIKDDVRQLYFEVQQVLGAIKPIFTTDSREFFVNRVERTSRSLSREVARLPMYSSIPRSGLEMVMFGGMISFIVMLLLSGRDLTGTLPRVGLIAIIAYRLMPSIQLIFANMGALAAAHQSLDEIVEQLAQQPDHVDSAHRSAGETVAPLRWEREVRFDQVTFRYPGAEAPALDAVSFAIAKGSRVAFVGPTGSGKSTLIDLLLGLLVPTGGAILVDGEPLAPEDFPRWRRAVGYVPQDVFLLDGTIAENIAFGHDAAGLDRQRVLAVAEIAQSSDFIETRSASGIDAVVGERGTKLSGGQRQRLALARALYPAPDTLVLDEATSALDPVTERKVTEAVGSGTAQLTIVTVAHRMSTIRDCDVIHFLEHGRILFSGRFDELQRDQPRFQEFLSHSA